jgi:hypothetical protein
MAGYRMKKFMNEKGIIVEKGNETNDDVYESFELSEDNIMYLKE